MTWLNGVVTGLSAPDSGSVVILLDPRQVIPPESLPDWAWHTVDSRWELRRLYEQHVRYRPAAAPPLLVQVCVPALSRRDALPWDISRLPVATLDPALPDPVVSALPHLPAEVSTELCRRVRAGAGPAPVLAELLFGVSVPAPDVATELLLALRAYSAGLPPAVRDLLLPALVDPLARDALGAPSATGPLASAWRDWCVHGESSPHHRTFTACGPALLILVEAGLLTPPTTFTPGLPAWLALATALSDPTPAIRELLDPSHVPTPSEFKGWASTAQWWARIRWACATGKVEPAVVDQAWEQWSQLDQEFLIWLQANYARELGRSYLPPRTIDKVTPFLAHQLRQRHRPQVLVVIDGMGLAQWNQLRAASGAREVESYLVLAGLPTITQVSRQALFAGRQPQGFAATIRSPAEERWWRTFWTEHGLSADQVQFLHSDGRIPPRLPDGVRAAAIVISLVDDALHASGSFGDVGFRDLVARFADSGYLQGLLGMARSQGWDLWFTADHGNLACQGLPNAIPRQGLRVSSRGKRVWTFAHQILRDTADVPGIAWDPPGYPQTAGYPLFAPSRTCYERDAVQVSHGGLSLDEVFVPLVRVEI